MKMQRRQRERSKLKGNRKRIKDIEAHLIEEEIEESIGEVQEETIEDREVREEHQGAHSEEPKEANIKEEVELNRNTDPKYNHQERK
jgi:hypothetical protein